MRLLLRISSLAYLLLFTSCAIILLLSPLSTICPSVVQHKNHIAVAAKNIFLIQFFLLCIFTFKHIYVNLCIVPISVYILWSDCLPVAVVTSATYFYIMNKFNVEQYYAAAVTPLRNSFFPLFYNFCRNHCPFVSLACNVRAVWSMNVCMFVSLYCYIFEFLLYLCSLYCHISCLSGWIPSTQSAYRVSFILFLRLGFCLLLLLLLLPLSNTKQQ